jgi:dihydropteroate synthase
MREQADRLIGAGAEIVDVGGESTRPGSLPVPADEEKRRILRAVKYLGSRKIIISIDTQKSSVAEAALDAGAHIINDISALTASPEMAGIAAKKGAAVILMHMQGTPQTMQDNPRYAGAVTEVRDFLKERIRFAMERGIARDRIIIDPGIGFGKSLEHSTRLLQHIDALCDTGYPVLIGVSRKSFIEKRMREHGSQPVLPDQRLAGSLAAVIAAYRKGVRMFRVHDVGETMQALRIARSLE